VILVVISDQTVLENQKGDAMWQWKCLGKWALHVRIVVGCLQIFVKAGELPRRAMVHVCYIISMTSS
jgi:hypothetical protein